MKKMGLLSALVVVGLVLAAAGGGIFKVGDPVFAEWTTNGWYHGKIDKQCEAGWHIAFDDGDQKCCTPQQIVLDIVPKAAKVKVGAKVLAQWSNMRYYPGTVKAITGGNYAIHYDDGDEGTVQLSQIRLR